MLALEQYLSYDFAVRHDDMGIVCMEQGGRKEYNISHLSVYTGQLNVFANSEWFCKNNSQPSNEIAEQPLHGKTHPDAYYPDPCYKRCNCIPI